MHQVIVEKKKLLEENFTLGKEIDNSLLRVHGLLLLGDEAVAIFVLLDLARPEKAGKLIVGTGVVVRGLLGFTQV